jgi:hypothetical protein
MDKKTQPENAHLGYDDTPVLPDSGYHVHDGTRPQPPVVSPGEGTQPPSDANVLFGGASLDGWQKHDGGEPGWTVENGYMEVVPHSGSIRTVEQFGDVQLHLEFASPAEVLKEGQGRGNSGVFLMGLYEVQVLDNYENPTYPDGTVGALYGQYPPLYNAIRKPGEWNAYDIFWQAPVFDGETLKSPAVITVMLNNVLLHHALSLQGPTQHKQLTEYKPHPAKGPLELQDHGDKVRFRNIWVRELRAYDR